MCLPKNREVRITFQPNLGIDPRGRRRFSVGVRSLERYVGAHNAETAIRRAITSGEDKYTVRLRKHGRIDFYFK